MKFGGYNEKAAERVNQFVAKLVGYRSLFVLLALASLVLAAGADNKFG